MFDQEKHVATKGKIEVQVPVERQKAAQAAGNFELEDLPGRLATPDAAVRLGKPVSYTHLTLPTIYTV